MLRAGSEWRAIGEGALHFGPGGAAWYGSDAVGVANLNGVTICKR